MKRVVSLSPTAVNNSPCHTDAMYCRRCNMPLMPLQCLRHSPRWFWYICSLYKYKYVMQWIASICLLLMPLHHYHSYKKKDHLYQFCKTEWKYTIKKNWVCHSIAPSFQAQHQTRYTEHQKFDFFHNKKKSLQLFEIAGEKLKSITLVLNPPRSQQYSNIADSPSPSVVSEFAT